MLTTQNISNSGIISTLTLAVGQNAFISNILNVGGVTNHIGQVNTVTISNSGAISTLTLGVGGNASISNNLVVGGALAVAGITTLGTTNTTSISNSGIISTLTVGVGGNASISNNLVVGGLTTLGVVSTNSISNSGNISTNSLNVGTISTFILSAGDIYASNVIATTLGIERGSFDQIFTSSIIIEDPNTLSTGSFRYSTLTTLFALPNTSLLYFNNLVVAGAYVWPGQTIQALNWAGGLNGTNSLNILSGQTFGLAGCNYNNVYVASTITGGTPPYSFTDVSATTLATRGLSICNTNPARFGLLFGTYNGTIPTTYNVLLTDNSIPKFTRNISFFFTPNPAI